jgi:hypothetical protein
MRKLIAIAALLSITAIGNCGDQPHNIGYVSTDGPLGLYSRTVAQMLALTPATTGQLIYVSDAATSKVCVSTGIGVGAWVAVSLSTGTVSSAALRCN